MTNLPRSKSKVRRSRADNDLEEQHPSRRESTYSVDRHRLDHHVENYPLEKNERRQQEHGESRKLARRGLRIGRTSVGKGVFATRKISDGTCIGEIEGEVILDDSYESRYSFDLDDGAQLEPAAPFRFVNHSCEPNCAFELISVSSETPDSETPNRQEPPNLKENEPRRSHEASPRRKLLLFAICDIEIGDELSIDYNWPATFAIPCQCKSPTCRGWIVNPKHLSRIE